MKIKSISELTDFYYSTLEKALENMDRKRQSVVRNYIIANVLITVAALVPAVWALRRLDHPGALPMWTLGLTFALWLAAVRFAYKWITERYAARFKAEIIRPLVHAIAPGHLHYYPANSVSQYQFQRSRLFVGKIDRYEGSDLVKGEIDGVHFQFSSVFARQKVEERSIQRSMIGRDMDEVLLKQLFDGNMMTLFRGFFMVAEFSKHFKGTTLVVPDAVDPNAAAYSLLFNERVKKEPWLGKDQRIKMDSPEFERLFNVYSTDSIEAHYLLTHSMMERIVGLKQMVGHRPLYLSFNGGHLYIAIAYDRELFEPSVFKSPKSYGVALEYIKTVRNSIAIIEELQIGTRIWSKAEGERSATERYLHDFDATLSPKKPPYET